MGTPLDGSRLFARGAGRRSAGSRDILRKETVGGALLLAAAVRRAGLGELALVATPTPRCGDLRVGPAALHLDLTLGAWAADGLLAIFFFVAGLELKREFVAGDLRDPRRAALPVAAAVGGMAVPALVYVAGQPRRRDGHCAAGRSRPRPTSRSRSPCSR